MLNIKQSSFVGFLAGGGEMGALTRAYDWSASAIGPPESWPQSLRTAIRIVLNTNHPMLIWWGPDFIQFYNDAYRRTLGPERHPSALGQRGRECWTEAWPIIGSRISQVMSGSEPAWRENQPIPVIRNGRVEQLSWSYDYSPIDQDDAVGGVLLVGRGVTADDGTAETLRARDLRVSEKTRDRDWIGGVAHDFNNLLTGIVGSLDLMQIRLDQGRAENMSRYIKAAMTSAHRAAALTQRLLAFAQAEALPTDEIETIGAPPDCSMHQLEDDPDQRSQ